jgi:hypothetical protein
MRKKTFFFLLINIIILNGQEIRNLTNSIESYYDSSLNDIIFEELNNEQILY